MTTQEQIKKIHEATREKCQKDILYFIRTFGHIEDKDAKDGLIQPFNLWPAQEEACLSIMDHKLNVILKARQLGITWLALHIAAWYLVLFTGRTVLALSKNEEDAKELIRRLEVILDNMPLIVEKKKAELGWQGPTYESTALSITVHWPDGPDCVFKGFASSAGAGRSFTADLFIFDEWAFHQFADKIWMSGFPTINRPNGGKFIGLSTIERGTLFENIFTDPDNGFNKIFIPWHADPSRNSEWYENTKRVMKDTMTHEYPATIEEALEVPGGAFFPEVNFGNTISKDKMEGIVRRYVCIDYGFDMFSAHWISVDREGHAQIYREYDAPDKTIRAACDILKDLSGDESIYQYLAPSDLWSREQITGKSRALHFSENGIYLTKTSRDFPAGCAAMKEWLEPVEGKKSNLTILEGTAPNLYRCLTKIQKDKNRPNVYAKDPHDLTHDPDSLRAFCIWFVSPADVIEECVKREWTPDMWEDYENAREADKELLLRKYGEPK